MLLPNMYQNIKLFSQRLQIYNATQEVIDFEPVQSFRMQSIVCTVQKADPDKLQIDNVDLHLNYIEVHADIRSVLKINDECFYNGRDYKLIIKYHDQDYGYFRAIFEEIIREPHYGKYTNRVGDIYIDRDSNIYTVRNADEE